MWYWKELKHGFIVRARSLITYERSGETKSIRGDDGGPTKREVFHFSNSGRALSGHLEEISSVLAFGTFLENAMREENRTVNPFAILSISLIAIKVMSYEIDCPHKIVSSPFCGPDSAKHISFLEARNKWPLSPLFRATLSTHRYHEVRLNLCDIYIVYMCPF